MFTIDSQTCFIVHLKCVCMISMTNIYLFFRSFKPLSTYLLFFHKSIGVHFNHVPHETKENASGEHNFKHRGGKSRVLAVK